MVSEMIPRIIKMFKDPRGYWDDVLAEPGEIRSLLPTMMVLAAIPAGAWLVGIGALGAMRQGFFGMGIFARFFLAMVVSTVLQYGLSIAAWIVLGYLIDAFAPTFSAQRDLGQSMKLATVIIPTWLGQVLAVTSIQSLAWLGMLAGLGFGGYLLFLGLPTMNGTPQDKAAGYAAAAIGCLLGIMFIIGALMCIPTACCMASAFLA